jgi:hypothetical protein
VGEFGIYGLVLWFQVITMDGAKKWNFTTIEPGREDHEHTFMTYFMAFPTHL